MESSKTLPRTGKGLPTPSGNGISRRNSKPLFANGRALQHASRGRGGRGHWPTGLATSPDQNLTKTARSTFRFPCRDPGRLCLNVARPFGKVTSWSLPRCHLFDPHSSPPQFLARSRQEERSRRQQRPRRRTLHTNAISRNG